jgi:DNA (cytosine-5)-methyltransferase 1
VLSDLGNIGYTAQPFVIPACAVNSPQRRDRVFIVAYAESVGSWGLPFGKRETFTGPRVSSQNVADPESGRRGETGEHFKRSEKRTAGGGWKQQKWAVDSGVGGMFDGVSDRLDGNRWPAYWGEEQKEWEPPRVASEIKNRNGRLKALGNAVNPYQVFTVIAGIKQIDDIMKQAEGQRADRIRASR